MGKKQINAVLWRSYLTSTSDALWGQRHSQYYIDLPKSDYEVFFDSNCIKSVDRDGNDIYQIILSPYEGSPPAASYELTFKKLRQGTGRAGSWNMNGQFVKQAYDLWKKERGPLKPFNLMNSHEREANYIVIFRDVEGRFHGRWIQPDDFLALPEGIQRILRTTTAGWSAL